MNKMVKHTYLKQKSRALEQGVLFPFISSDSVIFLYKE